MQFKRARGIRLIHLLKIGLDTRKYFRIVSNLLDILGLRKLPLQYELILQRYLPKTEKFTFFISLFDITRDSMMAP